MSLRPNFKLYDRKVTRRPSKRQPTVAQVSEVAMLERRLNSSVGTGRNAIRRHPSEMFAHEVARAAKSLAAWLQTGIPKLPGVDHMGPDLQAHAHVGLTCRGGKP